MFKKFLNRQLTFAIVALLSACGSGAESWRPTQSKPDPLLGQRAHSKIAIPLGLLDRFPPPPIGEPAPELKIQTLQGERVTLEEKRGLGVIVTFFATWCPSCQRELPVLAKQRGECGCLGLDVLPVNAVDEKPEKIRAFKEKFDIRMPLYLDPNAVMTGKWGITAVPTSYFVDRRGYLHAVRIGQVPEDELKKLIEEILKFGK